MKNSSIFAVAAVLASVGLLSTVFATRTVGQDQGKSDGLAEAKTKFAEALVKVAQADLAKAQEANAQAPEAVPSSVVRSLQDDVTMAKARVSMLEGKSQQESPYNVAAKASLAAAQESLRQANEVNAKTPGTINKSELARRQAELQLAQARVAVAQQLDKASPEERMQWELLLLQEEVHNLRFSVKLLQYHN